MFSSFLWRWFSRFWVSVLGRRKGGERKEGRIQGSKEGRALYDREDSFTYIYNMHVCIIYYIICRTPIWLKTAFAVLVQEGVLADPWIQSGSSRAPMSGGSQIHKKQHVCRVLARFWVILATSRQVQTWCQKLENWCPTTSRLDPDWFSSKKHLFPKI